MVVGFDDFVITFWRVMSLTSSVILWFNTVPHKQYSPRDGVEEITRGCTLHL